MIRQRAASAVTAGTAAHQPLVLKVFPSRHPAIIPRNHHGRTSRRRDVSISNPAPATTGHRPAPIGQNRSESVGIGGDRPKKVEKVEILRVKPPVWVRVQPIKKTALDRGPRIFRGPARRPLGSLALSPMAWRMSSGVSISRP